MPTYMMDSQSPDHTPMTDTMWAIVREHSNYLFSLPAERYTRYTEWMTAWRERDGTPPTMEDLLHREHECILAEAREYKHGRT